MQTMRSLVYAMLNLRVNPIERIKQKWNVNTKEKPTSCRVGVWSLEVRNDDQRMS